ncbi:MAG: YfhO family protein [Clostridiales bacterium]|nr:YfhO family protein [Clostridiales bacterium]
MDNVIKPKYALSTNKKQKEKYLFLFIVSFVIMMIVFLPTMIYNKGYFLYYGDFNSQQLMFYDHVQKAVKSGTLNYDWGTDLGSSYVGSYAFYLLGSPFFWITTLFPSGWAPLLIPWLLALKTAVASVTAYAFIRRFVRSTDAAAIGALLYAFSGFQTYNIFFNHFHDVTAFFPLMLLAVEMRVNDNKRGVFALTVALMASISYFFFAGQVMFLFIYYICRSLSKDFNINTRKFISLGIEAVLGVAMAAVLLLPAALFVTGNYRINESLSGINMIVYQASDRLYRIVQSFFMLPDPPARHNLFSVDETQWASTAGYLPLFSLAGVIAFLKGKKGHWAKRVVIACIVCAFVPILNTSFYMFNASYYARWYYMPILIMALMTAYVIDNQRRKKSKLNLKQGFTWVAGATLIFFVINMLPKDVNGEQKWFSVAKYQDLFTIQILVSFGMVLALGFIIKFLINNKNYFRMLTIMTMVSAFVCTGAIAWYCVSQGPYPETYITEAVNGNDQLQLESVEGEFYRLDTEDGTENYPMFWGFSSMRCFQSVVSPSIMEFYRSMDMQRGVSSKIETKYSSLRSVLGVKYYIERTSNNTKCSMPGFELVKTTENFRVYENKYFVPMGVAYDSYITQEEYDELNTNEKVNVLGRALIVDIDQYGKYSSILDKYSGEYTLATQDYFEMCLKNQENACYYFQTDNDGFTAKISLDEDKLVFFSVPHDNGWTAEVNGKMADVELVSNGMMAVKVPAGENSVIRFNYAPEGFKEGIIISISALVLFIAYMVISKKVLKPEGKAVGVTYDYPDIDEEESIEAEIEVKEKTSEKTGVDEAEKTSKEPNPNDENK